MSFLVFACHQYYPAGGWNDLQGKPLDTLRAAKQKLIKLCKSPNGPVWGHVVDSDKCEIVFQHWVEMNHLTGQWKR